LVVSKTLLIFVKHLKTTTMITLHIVDNQTGQKTIEVTEEKKNELVDLDIAWFDGKDWCVMECDELRETLAK